MSADASPGHGKLLLIEDNPADDELIRTLLGEDYDEQRILSARTLEAGIEALRRSDVELVILDLNLPDASGLKCVESVRAWVREVPIVILTGSDDGSLALECLAAGADDYLSKQRLESEALRRAAEYAKARAQMTQARRHLLQLRERLTALVQGSSDAILTLDQDTKVTSVNPAAARLFGTSSEGAIGRPLEELMGQIEPAGALHPVLLDSLSGEETSLQSITRLDSKGEPQFLELRWSSLETERRPELGLSLRDVSDARRREMQRQRHADALELREKELEALNERLRAVREEERARLSREVHDELGQLLTGCKLDLRWVQRHLADRPAEELNGRLDGLSSLLEQAMARVQQIALELRPSALDSLGIAAAIRDEARRFRDRSGIAVELYVDDVSPPEDAATTLFRVFQELLTNVARHAAASSVRIELTLEDGVIILVVADDGRGISATAMHGPSSLGLVGIRERVGTLGGRFTIRPAKSNRGTIATARLPASPLEP